MKIVIGSDHRGVEIKSRLIPVLRSMGHEVVDIGSDSAESVDYPDYAYEVAKRVGKGEAERGLLICGTGTGMCIAANKVRGVRAASCQDVLTAEKPVLVAANKMDALDEPDRLARLERHLQSVGVPLYPVSAATGQGLDALLEAVWREVARAREEGSPLPAPR